MPIDYGCNLAIGYKVSYLAIKKFQKVRAKRSHLEPRFDVMTGLPVKPVEVIDEEERSVYELFGKEFQDFEEICQGIAEELACDVATYQGDEYLMEDPQRFAIIGPRFDANGDAVEFDDHFSVGGSVDYDKVVGMGPELRRIREALSNLGLLEEGQGPIVALIGWVG